LCNFVDTALQLGESLGAGRGPEPLGCGFGDRRWGVGAIRRKVLIEKSLSFVEILEFRFSRDDSCHKLGLRHPVYQIMEALGRLKPGQAVRVETDDFDWAQTIEIVARGAGYSVSRERDDPPVLLIWR